MTPYFVVLIVAAAALFVKGFRKHRRTWTPKSWRRFAFAFVVSLLVSGGGYSLIPYIEPGPQFGSTPTIRAISFVGLLTVAVFAFAAPIHLLGWFATIGPDRQFGQSQGPSGHSPNTR